jgi:hypothetical protein
VGGTLGAGGHVATELAPDYQTRLIPFLVASSFLTGLSGR